MAARYAPLNLQDQLHDLPVNYGKRSLQFDGTSFFTAHQHVDKLNVFIELEEVAHEHVKLRLFAQSLSGEVKSWFRYLPGATINEFQQFESYLLLGGR